jgi:hypothetical protein
MKPVELIERAINNSSRPGDTVLDVFSGSGSTVIACEKTKRQGRLIELDPLYVTSAFGGGSGTREDFMHYNFVRIHQMLKVTHSRPFPLLGDGDARTDVIATHCHSWPELALVFLASAYTPK